MTKKQKKQLAIGAGVVAAGVIAYLLFKKKKLKGSLIIDDPVGEFVEPVQQTDWTNQNPYYSVSWGVAGSNRRVKGVLPSSC